MQFIPEWGPTEEVSWYQSQGNAKMCHKTYEEEDKIS